ncbi:NB-ARC domain-containing protein [Saccharopolyspora sp. 5N708]|uniref:NB-ARC domain-containing protein n=1 Tax=Saccharopolyspora sp. 5N708 TaxID=3457424 RepID=UPI003FD5B1CE
MLNKMSGDVRGNFVQAGSIHGPVTFQTADRVTGPGLGSVAAPTQRLVHSVHGRDELVAAVTDLVRSGRKIAVVHGAGGLGKTTLALRVVENVAHDTEAWWVDASSEASLGDGLREVALRAGASPQDVREAWEGRASAPDLLWRQVNQLSNRWLLVFDNADDAYLLAASQSVADGTGWLRAPTDNGGVLITTRDGNPSMWGKSASTFAVRSLSKQDGARMLLDRAPTAGSVEQAEGLADRLGGQPLALHLAGRYLATATEIPLVPGLDLPPTEFDGYRRALDHRWAELTDVPETVDQRRDREILSRTWELSLDLLAERGQPVARPLLRLLSCLAPAPIPLELLRAETLSQNALFADLSAQKLALVIKALELIGLVEFTALSDSDSQGVPVLVLHPVVRETNRHGLLVGEQSQDHLDLAVALLDATTACVGCSDPTTWPRWRALLPHCGFAAVALRHRGGLGKVETQYRAILERQRQILEIMRGR